MQGVRERGWQGVCLGSRGSDDASGSSTFRVPFAPSYFLPSSLSPFFHRLLHPSVSPPFLYRILSRNIRPRWGSKGGRMSAGVLSSPGFFMVMLWRPETACEIRDMCRAVRAFAISSVSFYSPFRSRLFVALNLDCEAKLCIVCGAKYTVSRQRQ